MNDKSKELTLECGVKVIVTSDGKVLKDGHELHLYQYPDGYLYITVKSKEHYLVHKLVASAFIQPLKRGDRTLQVHHIDGNKTNNRIENLQVMTMQEHQHLHKQIHPKIKTCLVCGKEFTPKPTKRKRNQTCSWECSRILAQKNMPRKKINQYTPNGELIKTWPSARDAQNELGIFESNINKCCNGHIKTYKGFVWRYCDY